ncbi:NXPE family member 4-like [Mercenaria mercenaria]|uniref:NXPE family member 4-like n=1 Tax=Mercenaria mercenaria TaxID=6596 RepID=UPI00234F19C9|nr:NXPE family member 4-like [Mercenaria mercenaria]
MNRNDNNMQNDFSIENVRRGVLLVMCKIGLVALVVVFLSFALNVTSRLNLSGQLFSIQVNTSQSKKSYGSKANGISNPHDPRFYNIILEEEALKFKPCQDINKTASVRHSKIKLSDRVNRTYNIGEEVVALVKLYDCYGNRKRTGGDHIRATLENKQLKASVPCVVTDNRNGTQTLVCEALWIGTATINVLLAYTRETVTSLYRIRTQGLATRHIFGMFKSRTYSKDINYSEVTTCHPNHTYFLYHENNTAFCNFTYINSGLPFYCGKPKDEHLLCHDWELVRTGDPFPELPITECEDILLKSGQRAFEQTLTVNIRNRNEDDRSSIKDEPSIPCSKYNRSLLWRSRETTGFFYNGEWKFRNCVGFKVSRYKKCLAHRRLYLFGDSTNRAWYSAFLQRFKCEPITEKWGVERWHKDSECYNKQIDFKAGWYPHAQPFNIGEAWDDVKYTITSISRRIDNIPRNERAIVVIHVFLHMAPYHHNVFTQKIENIRKSVETFLENNKHSVVMIKAPHTYVGTPAGGFRLSDYYGFVYSKILYEVFEGLHDKVVLLNNKDSTIAQHVEWNHPPGNIINIMIDQMLSYACDY